MTEYIFIVVWQKKKKNLFLDGHSHVRFDLAERFHQEL